MTGRFRQPPADYARDDWDAGTLSRFDHGNRTKRYATTMLAVSVALTVISLGLLAYNHAVRVVDRDAERCGTECSAFAEPW